MFVVCFDYVSGNVGWWDDSGRGLVVRVGLAHSSHVLIVALRCRHR